MTTLEDATVTAALQVVASFLASAPLMETLFAAATSTKTTRNLAAAARMLQAAIVLQSGRANPEVLDILLRAADSMPELPGTSTIAANTPTNPPPAGESAKTHLGPKPQQVSNTGKAIGGRVAGKTAAAAWAKTGLAVGSADGTVTTIGGCDMPPHSHSTFSSFHLLPLTNIGISTTLVVSHINAQHNIPSYNARTITIQDRPFSSDSGAAIHPIPEPDLEQSSLVVRGDDAGGQRTDDDPNVVRLSGWARGPTKHKVTMVSETNWIDVQDEVIMHTNGPVYFYRSFLFSCDCVLLLLHVCHRCVFVYAAYAR